MKSLTGKTALVTGATAGIGEATAKQLASAGARVVLVSRNPEKLIGCVKKIQEETGNQDVEYLQADLSSQQDIRAAAKAVQQANEHVDILINNAGAVFMKRQLSPDGIEMTFALNHLGYFLFTNLLLDRVKSSAPARIVNISSNGHFGAPLDFGDLELKKGYNAWKAYRRSKFANVLFTYELARRLEGTGVTANAVHPGLVKSNIGKSAGKMMDLVWKVFTRFSNSLTPEESAKTSFYAAADAEMSGISGKYIARGKFVDSDPDTYSTEAAKRLWAISAQMTNLKF